VIESDGKNLKRFIWLTPENILALCIPRELGGIKKFRKLLSKLRWLSKCTIPEFAMKDMAAQQQTKGYEFSIYRENQETLLARMTSQLGWGARGAFNERALEFYQIHRYLKFEKTKAILREYVLSKLNHSLEKVGRVLGFNAKIKLEGIPSSHDYDNYITKLIGGSLQFSEAVKLVGL
jgi:hypothetical protein